MKGAGEPTWDYEDALGDGSVEIGYLGRQRRSRTPGV